MCAIAVRRGKKTGKHHSRRSEATASSGEAHRRRLPPGSVLLAPSLRYDVGHRHDNLRGAGRECGGALHAAQLTELSRNRPHEGMKDNEGNQGDYTRPEHASIDVACVRVRQLVQRRWDIHPLSGDAGDHPQQYVHQKCQRGEGRIVV